jgi:hypothetical protein
MKTFKQFISEEHINVDGVDFDLGMHFLDRIKERSELTRAELNELIKKIREKLSKIKPMGEFLFYSRKLKQGIIAAWDSFKQKLKMITFLPRGKEFPKPGTEKIVMENIQYDIIYID